MPTSIDQIGRIDFRRRRSEALTAALMNELQDVLYGEQFRAVYERLYSVLYENSVSWVTEEDRVRLGLEPRDDLGWTPSEMVRMRMEKLEAMQILAASPFLNKPVG